VYRAKYHNLNVPSIPLHVSGRQLCWSFHFLIITLSQWLLSSFGAKRCSFMKKQVLCLFHRNIVHITEIFYWLQLQSSDWSVSANCLIAFASEVQHLQVLCNCLFLIAPTISSNYFVMSKSGTAARSSSTYSSHTLHHTKHNSIRCGKHEGTRANHPSPTNTR
jgi:hypothetical protein